MCTSKFHGLNGLTKVTKVISLFGPAQQVLIDVFGQTYWQWNIMQLQLNVYPLYYDTMDEKNYFWLVHSKSTFSVAASIHTKLTL